MDFGAWLGNIMGSSRYAAEAQARAEAEAQQRYRRAQEHQRRAAPSGFPFGPDPFDGFDMGGLFGMAEPQQQQRHSNVPPPASSTAIQSLPKVVVTPEDIGEDAKNNQECSICLEPQHVGNKATKLPCGHIFCSGCIVPWLRKNCTCPVCRYELPTNDAQFEAGRKDRMKQRKMRFRKRDLQNMSVRGLRQLMNEIGVSSEGCLEKSDMLDRLEASSRVELIPECPSSSTQPHVYSRSQLMSMTVPEIKDLMARCNLALPEEAVEKEQLLGMLVSSGRVIVSSDDTTDDTDMPDSDNNHAGGSAQYTLESLRSLRVKELKELIASLGGSSSDCVEKADLVQRLVSLGILQQ
ncbi:RING-H2 finger protein ATL5O, putative [Perkinsus marinus ATCC 50983]|uniref:RING-H2 finger protein ATL5O, putative n=1 Tax=Perkinsus marinus (strain ATCC 50983 / TXsc) TaxID=423536 RepID=C5KRT3_PERM5|nr:RING-H2 finger protein ATL5O, putative [Perkinsus marinus ATCC 50983]EER12774.1 RING-H2 finger protein ATL5O, putative [Perkinsus marinus ATCC 50983]|eukprot:XP_002780979.1 RING-H2 finger protein ATL5O, putative [Perkinsus marinus ATCC 50983]